MSVPFFFLSFFRESMWVENLQFDRTLRVCLASDLPGEQYQFSQNQLKHSYFFTSNQSLFIIFKKFQINK
jgi:hypothetical protein